MIIFEESESIWMPMEHHEYSHTAKVGNPFHSNAKRTEEIFRRMARHQSDFIQVVKRFPVEIANRDYQQWAYSIEP